MILSDCTDRNVAGVNESFSVPVLLQTRSDRRKPPSQVDARRVFFFLFCFVFLSFTINLSPSNPHSSYSLLFVVSLAEPIFSSQ